MQLAMCVRPATYKNWVGLCGELTAVTKKMSWAQLWRLNEWDRLPFQSLCEHSLKHLEKFHVKKNTMNSC